MRDYTPERVAEITGLTPETIFRTAWTYARAEAAFIGWTMGVNHSTKGTETVNAINNLALITGNIGRAGAAPFSITGQCNAMGTREAGLRLEHARLPQVRERRTTARSWPALWNVPVERIPTARGLAYPDIIEAALEKKIRALWIIATNPIVSFPNLKALQQALEGLEFLVVQDGYHPTPTSEFAHLMLPAAIWGEKEGTYTNSERRVSKVNRAVARPEKRGPTSTSSSASPTCSACATRCSRVDEARRRLRGVEARRPGRLCDYSGMTYKAIEQHGGVQWPFPAGLAIRRDTAALHRRRLPDRRRPRQADLRSSGSRSPSSRTTSSRSCSTPAARSSTGTRAPRPARCRSSNGCRRTPGWR